MATKQDIESVIQKLDEKWSNPPARDGLFGNALKSVTVKNVRATDTTVEFTWPVTVIGGTNGSGKTTVLQACSSAYVKEVGGRYFKLGDWIRGALAGETPAIKDPARISYSFWNTTPTFEVPYQPENTRWRYPRRNNPQRRVEFFGITAFAPRIERKDRTHVFRSRLEIKNSTQISNEALQSISRILGSAYDEGVIHVVGVAKGTWSADLPQVKQSGNVYSEPQMGAGEQKVVRLVQALELLPLRTLILLEEPELTLHPDAQRGFTWYLMNLSLRKGHQVIIASHSTEIFEALPIQARILLVRDKGTVQAYHKVPYLRAARELSSSVKSNKDLILVEDCVAQEFLAEILRRHDRALLESSCIVPIGNTDDVYRMVKSFRAQGVRTIGVRDPDIGDSPDAAILSLPGNKAPESLLLEAENLERAEKYISGLKEAFDCAKAAGLGLHGSAWAKRVFAALEAELGYEKGLLADRLTLAWLGAEDEKSKQLVLDIRASYKGA